MSSQRQPLNTLKCVFVGDSTSGKRSCINSFTYNTPPSDYIPSCTPPSNEVDLTVDEITTRLYLWDTNGSNEAGIEKYRSLSYPHTDVFLIAFSVISPSSFTSVRTKWLVELKRHEPSVPIILVGMKSDLRKDTKISSQLQEKGLEMVTEVEARKCAEEIGATGYYECSSLTKEGFKALFDEVVRVGRVKKASDPKKKSCTIQ